MYFLKTLLLIKISYSSSTPENLLSSQNLCLHFSTKMRKQNSSQSPRRLREVDRSIFKITQPLGKFLSFLAGNRANEGMRRPRGLRRFRKTKKENILSSRFGVPAPTSSWSPCPSREHLEASGNQLYQIEKILSVQILSNLGQTLFHFLLT